MCDAPKCLLEIDFQIRFGSRLVRCVVGPSELEVVPAPGIRDHFIRAIDRCNPTTTEMVRRPSPCIRLFNRLESLSIFDLLLFRQFVEPARL